MEEVSPCDFAGRRVDRGVEEDDSEDTEGSRVDLEEGLFILCCGLMIDLGVVVVVVAILIVQ